LVEAVRHALVMSTGSKQALPDDMAVTERLEARAEPRRR
jgi:hypothetical protein